MSNSSRIAAVILAAGSSTRLGRPKQSLLIGGETLVERALRTAQDAGLSPVIVVLRPAADFGPSLEERGALIVCNDRAHEGMASSIRLGVNLAGSLKAGGVVLITCDQVGLTLAHLRALVGDPGRVTGSAYAGKIGIPVYFPASSFAELLALQGDSGARDLLRGAASIADEDLALDIDTPEDLERVREILARA